MKYRIPLQIVEKFAAKMLQKALPSNLVYHNFRHTFEVVEAAASIGKRCEMSADEIELVQIAAWLHDLGHIKEYMDHESESQLIGMELLCMAGMPDKEKALIIGCIGATRMPQCPTNLYEAVLCDADLSHLASPNFLERSALLRKEWERVLGKYYSDEAWVKDTFQFLSNHRYHTLYGQTVLHRKKLHNMFCMMSSAYAWAA